MHDETFRALSDPTRRAILKLLAKREATAGDIAEHFTIGFPAISRHLSILKAANLVDSTRDGQFIRYRLNTTVFQDAVRYLAGILGESRK